MKILVNSKFVNFVSYSVLGSLNAFLNLLLLPFYTKILSPESYGKIAFIDSIIMFIAVFSIFGIHSFFIKEYKNYDKKMLLSSLTYFLFLYNLAILILGSIFAVFIFNDDTSKTCFLLALFTNFCNTFLILPLRELKLKEEGLKYGLIYGTLYLLQSLGSVLLIYLGFDILGRYISYCVFSFIYMVLILFFYRQQIGLNVNNVIIKNALSLGAFLVLGNLSMMVINLSDRILLKHFVDFGQLGIYSVGYTLGVWLSILAVAFFNTFEPSLYLEKYGELFQKKFKFNLLLSYVLLSIPVFMIFHIGNYVYGFFLNEKYLRGLEVTKVTVLIVLYIVMYNFLNLVAIRFNFKRMIFSVTFLGAIVNILINILIIPRLGIIGAAYSTLVAYSIMVFTFLVLLNKQISKSFFLIFIMWSIPIIVISSSHMMLNKLYVSLIYAAYFGTAVKILFETKKVSGVKW